MHDVVVAQTQKCVSNVRQVLDGLRLGEARARLLALVLEEISVVAIVHHQEEIERVLHDVVQVDYVRMLDFGHHVDFGA